MFNENNTIIMSTNQAEKRLFQDCWIQCKRNGSFLLTREKVCRDDSVWVMNSFVSWFKVRLDWRNLFQTGTIPNGQIHCRSLGASTCLTFTRHSHTDLICSARDSFLTLCLHSFTSWSSYKNSIITCILMVLLFTCGTGQLQIEE